MVLAPHAAIVQKKDVLRLSCTYANSRKSTVPPPINSGQQDEHHHVGGSSGLPGIFAGQVSAAIDARFGLPSGGRPSLIPMTDAPLFGSLCRQDTGVNNQLADSVLPPRKHADQLLDIYWRHVQPLEPFLEQERFVLSYQAVFAGTELDVDERIFLSSLNIVFALSTQLQEFMQPKEREEASNTYFHRAWTLLRPESILWETGSLEIVQCLLLMSRYLQCTNNPHQTWMAVGSAVRIAQSLGLHIPETSSSGPKSRESRRRKQLWQCCVFMDRGISWVLGRTSMSSLTHPPATINLLNDDGLTEQPTQYFTKMLELYEISNHIMLSQISPSTSFADKLGLPRLYQNEDPFVNVVKLDSCLDKWEKSLPSSLRLENSQSKDDALYRQAFILRLRLLHAQILLFRPMLARFCISHPQAGGTPAPDPGLGEHLIHNSATLCVEGAQKMIDLVDSHRKLDGTLGILPWWNRIFYIHVAGTVLIASMLRADLFTPAVSQSWNKTMLSLRAHEHLSPFVQQCVTAFQTLSSRILETHPPGNMAQLRTPEDSSLQGVFQEIGFDPESFLFGMEDMAWLSSLEPTR